MSGDHIVPLDRFPVALPEGPHPFPFRTRSLSPPGPMVLCGQLRGRVGRCRDYFRRSESWWTPSACFFFLDLPLCLYDCPPAPPL
jgi:hypothetical protein